MRAKKSPQEINRGLAHIRRLRRIFLSVLFSLFPILALTMAYIRRSGNWFPIIFPAFLFFFGMFIQHRLHKRKCPRCNDFFFVQTVSKDNYAPASSISFPPQKKCRNCGLVLYH
ncbi:MAG: hypothetical protein R2941_22365 [Desulfobacterales bacterium]